MSDWKTRIEATMSQGKQPTYDELEAALLGALVERRLLISNADAQTAALRGALEQNQALVSANEAQAQALDDLTLWLGKISDAYLKHDGGLMADIVRDFVHERVVVVDKPVKGQVH